MTPREPFGVGDDVRVIVQWSLWLQSVPERHPERIKSHETEMVFTTLSHSEVAPVGTLPLGPEGKRRRTSHLLHQPASLGERVSLVRKALRKTFTEYCSTTKVNGPFYWQRGVTRGKERVLWVLIPGALLVMASVLVYSLWTRYLQSPTRMTIGRPLSVVQVPFPAVSICHPRTVVEYKALDFVERM